MAFRSLSATDIADLATDDNVKVVDGPGGEIRYITFNFDTQPYGTKADGADPAKALAVRQAVADLVDRAPLSEQVYKGTYTPAVLLRPGRPDRCHRVPQGPVRRRRRWPRRRQGEGHARGRRRHDSGRAQPAVLGRPLRPVVGRRVRPVKEQLEKDGLFTVDLQTTEWVQYSKDRTADVFPAYQLGWFPDYSDADNYLTPFFLKENFLSNHYDNPTVTT